MHLTVNEVEKMAVGEKIKFCQILELEQGAGKAGAWRDSDRSAPHTECFIAGYAASDQSRLQS